MNIDLIKERVASLRRYAIRTLDGETDGYDGSDAAEEICDLCEIIGTLIEALPKQP